MDLVHKLTLLDPRVVDVPLPVARAFAQATQWGLRKPRYTVEELDYWAAGDNVVAPENAELHTIDELGLPASQLATIEKTAVSFLRLYRKAATLNLIVE